MKSLKWLGVGFLVLTGALVACANGSTVAEDEQDVTKPADDASTAADTFRPSLRDSSTPTGDSSTTADASRTDASTTPDSSTGVDSSVPPTDSGTGIADCNSSDFLLSARALVQITNLDFPSCNTGCTTCCWTSPVRFCLK